MDYTRPNKCTEKPQGNVLRLFPPFCTSGYATAPAFPGKSGCDGVQPGRLPAQVRIEKVNQQSGQRLLHVFIVNPAGVGVDANPRALAPQRQVGKIAVFGVGELDTDGFAVSRQAAVAQDVGPLPAEHGGDIQGRHFRLPAEEGAVQVDAGFEPLVKMGGVKGRRPAVGHAENADAVPVYARLQRPALFAHALQLVEGEADVAAPGVAVAVLYRTREPLLEAARAGGVKILAVQLDDF